MCNYRHHVETSVKLGKNLTGGIQEVIGSITHLRGRSLEYLFEPLESITGSWSLHM